MELGGEKFQIGNAYSLIEKVFLSFCVDDIKIAGTKQNLAPMCKKLMKQRLILRSQHHFLTRFSRMHSTGMQTKRENH